MFVFLPEELGSCGAHLYDPAGQALPVHHGGHGGQPVPLHQTAGDPCGSRALLRGYHDAQAVVATAAHGPAPGINHEADQEAVEKEGDKITSTGRHRKRGG